jgi:hypothetical protein
MLPSETSKLGNIRCDCSCSLRCLLRQRSCCYGTVSLIGSCYVQHTHTDIYNIPSTRHGGAWGERRYSSYSFSTSALDGGEWSASRPGRAFTPGEGTPGTHWTGGWVGPRAGLDTEVRGKILLPPPEIEPRSPGRPARSQTLYCLS